MAKVVDKRFTFMESYLRSISKIYDKDKKLDFLMKVLNYGIYQDEPKFDNDFARGYFEEIKSHIDLSLHQREINKINGLKGGAPKGNTNAKKQTKTTETTENKLIENNRRIIESNRKEEIYKDLPSGLRESLEEFEKMRKQIKKPLTDRARETIIKRLVEYSNGDINKQIEVINQSIVNCWSNVYPLRKELVSVSNNKGVSTEEILKMGGII